MSKTKYLTAIIIRILGFGLLLAPAFAGDQKDYKYLALGDSISFGMDLRLLPTAPGQPVPTPGQFTGYPEIIAEIDSKFKKAVNGSCPGETSSSFLWGPPDNGCNSVGPTGQGPFKPVVGLHTNYPGTQMAYAVSELSANKHIKLVTLSIGANDVLVVLANCSIAGGDVPACIASQMPIALAAYGRNLTEILTAIRGQYDGTLILVNYYSPSADLNGVVGALNDVIAQAGTRFEAKVADGFDAFRLASMAYGGDPCKAELITQLGAGTCDLHPSLLGQKLLAAAVELTLDKH